MKVDGAATVSVSGRGQRKRSGCFDANLRVEEIDYRGGRGRRSEEEVRTAVGAVVIL